MKIFICYSRDRHAEELIEANKLANHRPYEEDGSIFIDIDRGSLVYRSPSAVEQYVSSGLYNFDEKGRPHKVS